MSEDHPLYEKVWSYSPGETLDIEFGENVIWYLDEDTLEKVYDEGSWQVTLTREEAKQFIKDLQEWLDGEM